MVTCPGALTITSPDDVAEVVALRNAVSAALTERHGIGHWSSQATEKGLRRDMRRASVYVLKNRGRVIATLALQTRKPRAIDRACFTPVKRPLYLIDMAVAPARQRSGLGRCCVADAIRICKAWPADALRLDAYDSDAGAGAFYRKCGLTEVGRAVYKNTPLIYYERLV
jgi:GNAT superfamily N-acetyltransferase